MWRAAIFSLVCLSATRAFAQAGPPAPHDDAAFDFMNLLSHHGLHDIDEEWWNVYGQFTFIGGEKLPFSAPYTNANGSNHSLLPGAEFSFTGSFTLFFGVKLWHGAEFYVAPEIIAERPLSNLTGLGGAIQNFELQKTGSETPQIYRSRGYVRQFIALGGGSLATDSNPLQLGRRVDKRRLVLTLGDFSILDVFDRSNVNPDPRQGFLNMAFMTHAAWDFAADARGYSFGATLEFYWDDWAVRFGHMAPPQNPNSLPVDLEFWKYFGEEIELEHDHDIHGLFGAVRLLGYRNQEVMGRFADAIQAYENNPAENAAACTSYNYGSQNTAAPDLCWVRKPNVKLGVGLSAEQFVAKDIGLVFRAMYSDGQTEVNAFNSADSSLSLSALAHGNLWHRRFDVVGAGVAMSWISAIHAQYLAMGGVDGFIGDGKIHAGPEGVTEIFYSVNVLKAIWLSADYQFLFDPGFNTQRGPVHILGARVHAEF